MAEKTTASFVLSLIAGILILINGIATLAIFGLMGAAVSGLGAVAGAAALGAVIGGMMIAIGAVALVFGIIVLVGALMLRKQGKETTWGIIILIFSIIALFVGGGFLVGSILGIVGGALAIAKK